MLIADMVLLIHFAFIAFVIGGQCLIMIGYHRKWGWAANRLMRGIHLACALYVVIQTWADQWCPLTLLENRYREAAGQETYGRSFIQDWVGRLIYYDAPPWVFTVIYTVFGIVVVLYGLLAERRRVRAKQVPYIGLWNR
ncbi:MAG: DUF2784 domain-containing protein [Deltaproteobacteria bacterium]|nr:DUF2784 domain-containing protein [Deltaproteobacteria bacterium]